MAWKPLLAFGCWLTLAHLASAQTTEDAKALPEASTTDGQTASSSSTDAGSESSSGSSSEAAASAISGNPGATNILIGTGALGRLLGFDKDSGVYLGGAWIGDSNWLMSGGLRPGKWTYDFLTLLDLTLDAEKLVGIKGGMFGLQFLQFTGQSSNEVAGTVMSYEGLEATPPLVRQEIYELWWRQTLFDNKLIIRIGKSVPTYDFNNVSRPVPTTEVSANIPSVTGLIYTPIFKTPTQLGKMPGYYNSATGVTATFAPQKDFYFSYGAFDGSQAIGEQTGLNGPQFNGHYFHIGEVGFSWRIGPEQKPGSFGCGLWDQTGPLTAANGTRVHGADGVYLFGSQRLWFQRPGQDNSGVSGFYQFGANNSNTSFVRQYCGLGLTGFGLVPGRAKDSMGCGMAWGWLNTDPNAGTFFFSNVPGDSTSLRTNEMILQSYYQMQLKEGAYLQPVFTCIPNPGERPGIRDAWVLTMRLILLF
jgi:porin